MTPLICRPAVAWSQNKGAVSWNKWLQRLKDDQMQAGAEMAVIVTSAFPRDCKEPFMMNGDVWIASDTVVRPIAAATDLQRNS